MRILTSASVATAAAAACLLLAPASHALSPATKGDNGTVKIHDAVTDAEYDKRNNPKVCEFYLDAFQFDAAQEVSWKIYEHPHSPEEPSLEGDITLDGDGHGRTEDMTLPDGQYKLYWTFEGKKGAPKHKVFKVDCESTETSGGTTGGDEETTGGSTEGVSEGTTGETTEGAAGGEETTGGTEGSTGEGSTGETTEGTTGDEATEGVAGGEEPGASTGEGGNLAETGSEAPVAALAAAAAALLGAGSYLVMRRRKAAQG